MIKYLVLFFLIFSLNSTQTISEKLVIQKPLATVSSPVRLKIPAIGVNAAVEHIGVNTRGDMEVPSNAMDVGWFKLGSLPGQPGSAVISGHLSGEGGEAGVFANLDKLKEGDELYVEDDKGKIIPFVVSSTHTYIPGYAEEVFSKNDGAYLNLVTCDGVWDKNKKSYTKRLVVFAKISN